MKYLRFVVVVSMCLTLLCGLVVPAYCGDYHFIGVVTKIEKAPRYPFETKDGRIWECKLKIQYTYYDPEYGWIQVKYKAYPLRFSGYEWACNIALNSFVEVMAHSKKDTKPPKRGDIIYIHGLE